MYSSAGWWAGMVGDSQFQVCSASDRACTRVYVPWLSVLSWCVCVYVVRAPCVWKTVRV